MALIVTNQLAKIFRRGDEEIAAVRDVSVSIDEGEFVAITGSSGSGKSTLLYILGLLDTATKGEYLFHGGHANALSDDERARIRNGVMGFVFQSFHLLARATALRNVMMPLVYASNYGLLLSESERRDRASAALERVGLGDRMKHVPNELSGGQRQRVAIARALVNSPKVLFADEPTGNLDSRTGIDILNLFTQLNSEGVTVIMVTHDLAIAARARRKLILRDGLVESDKSGA
jgi:putative ABC transport system ATP-binding protein